MPHGKPRWMLWALTLLGWVLVADVVLWGLTPEDAAAVRPAWLLAIEGIVAAVLLMVAGSLAVLGDRNED